MPAQITHVGTLPNTGCTEANIYSIVDNATISGITGSEIASNTVTNANLQTISTAGKVTGAALTALASIPSAAGNLPTANCPTTITLPDQSSAPTTAANTGAVYCKAVSGASELFYREESDGDEVQITSGGAVSGGKLAQVKYTQYASATTATGNVPADTSKPTWAEVGNVAGLQCKITPKSASNKLKITTCIKLGGAESAAICVALFKDGDGTDECISSASEIFGGAAEYRTCTFVHWIDAGDTNEQTYDIGCGRIGTSGTVYINQNSAGVTLGGTMLSSLTIEEIIP